LLKKEAKNFCPSGPWTLTAPHPKAERYKVFFATFCSQKLGSKPNSFVDFLMAG
jgi:hypothetical protein